MVKNGHDRDGKQAWRCARLMREKAAAHYAANRDRRREQFRAYHERNALNLLIKRTLRYHQNRLVELQKAVTEGGRDG